MGCKTRSKSCTFEMPPLVRKRKRAEGSVDRQSGSGNASPVSLAMMSRGAVSNGAEASDRDEWARTRNTYADVTRRALDEYATSDEWADPAGPDYFELAPWACRPGFADAVVDAIPAASTSHSTWPATSPQDHAKNSP